MQRRRVLLMRHLAGNRWAGPTPGSAARTELAAREMQVHAICTLHPSRAPELSATKRAYMFLHSACGYVLTHGAHVQARIRLQTSLAATR